MFHSYFERKNNKVLTFNLKVSKFNKQIAGGAYCRKHGIHTSTKHMATKLGWVVT